MIEQQQPMVNDASTALAAQDPALDIGVKALGLVEYEPTWRAMQAYTSDRGRDASDEIWLLEHPAVYTLGIAGKTEHLPRIASGIPVVRTDRGGQITYHGPGQLVAYLLLDMRRRELGVRALVRRMEAAVIDLLQEYGIASHGREGAPGVYVGSAKIAALGLRIRNGCCYHGIALNIDMDLAPFHAIDPCGYPGLEVTQLRDLGVSEPMPEVRTRLSRHLVRNLQ
jgi:lipoyl(octanoyl) transferase